MARSSTFSLTALVMGSILLLLSGNARAAWIEDFESYADGPITAPWDAGTILNMDVESGIGFTGKGVVGDNINLGTAHRATVDVGSTVLTARLWVDSNSTASRMYVGFHTAPTTGAGQFINSDGVIIYLRHHPEGAFFALESSDYTAGVFQSKDDEVQFGELSDTWYDVRITLNGDNTINGDYKQTTSGTWLPIGDGVVNVVDTVNFAPNYVAIAGEEGAVVDDISINVIPEPVSFSLMAIGGLAMLWMRRRSNRC